MKIIFNNYDKLPWLLLTNKIKVFLKLKLKLSINKLCQIYQLKLSLFIKVFFFANLVNFENKQVGNGELKKNTGIVVYS